MAVYSRLISLSLSPACRLSLPNFNTRFASATSHSVPAESKRSSGAFVWGDNAKGSLGLGHTKVQLLPTEIILPDVVVQSSCGNQHSAFLTASGEVFTCGEGKYFRLGHGDDVSQLLPKRVEGLPAIAQIACGYYHTMAVSRTGQVFVWGWGGDFSFGQGALGLGDKQSQKRPMELKLPNDAKIDQISAGQYHSLAKTVAGVVYSWGSGEFGRLGTGDTGECSTPREISPFSFQGQKVVHISSGPNFNIVSTEDGKLWSFGRNDHGQLGTGPSSKLEVSACEGVPTEILLGTNEKAGVAACGITHSLACTESGKLYIWGDKTWMSPHLIESIKNRKIVTVGAGKGVSAAIDDKGVLFLWGKPSSKCLATVREDIVHEPHATTQFSKRRVLSVSACDKNISIIASGI